MADYTKEELLESLQKLGKELGKSPTANECIACPYTANVTTYRSRFGSWNKAKELAGVSGFNKFGTKTDEQLIESLQKFYKEHKRAPKQKECRIANGLYGPNTYKERFGTWKEVLATAGVEESTLRSTQLTDEELLKALRTYYNKHDRAPRHEDCNDIHNHDYLKSHMVYARRFGTFTNALHLAGVPVNEKIISGAELDLRDAIVRIYSGEVQCSIRPFPNDEREIDIFIPEFNLGIEFDGLYWHSSERKDKTYHIQKTVDAEKLGIRLIHVFENEWAYKKELVLSRIKSYLGLNKVIYARKCTIKEVNVQEAREFLDKSHMQGFVGAKIKLGLYFENELVAIQTFGVPRYNKSVEWELLRYCNKLNTSVVGGASKLFKYFVNNYNPKSIISYSDKRWNIGSLYETLGFEYSHSSKPNYWYFKGRKLESRQKYQKHRLKDQLDKFDPSLTEYENMRNNGFFRIYDCGSDVYHWKFKS